MPNDVHTPTFIIEQRWRTDIYERYVYSWCLIQDGRAYPYGEDPFEIDMWVLALTEAGVTNLDALGAWSDPNLTRRSPPDTDEEAWLRENDVRHPEYTGA